MKNYSDRMQNATCFTDFEKSRLQAKETLISRFHSNKYDSLNYLEQAIVNESNSEVLAYISGYLNLKLNTRSIILTTTCCSYLDNIDFDNVRAIINLEPKGKSRRTGKLFKAVNTLLPDAGIYIGLSGEIADSPKICEEFLRNGFEIIDISIINNALFFTALKTSESAIC
jgi:hypothetical protein